MIGHVELAQLFRSYLALVSTRFADWEMCQIPQLPMRCLSLMLIFCKHVHLGQAARDEVSVGETKVVAAATHDFHTGMSCTGGDVERGHACRWWLAPGGSYCKDYCDADENKQTTCEVSIMSPGHLLFLRVRQKSNYTLHLDTCQTFIYTFWAAGGI